MHNHVVERVELAAVEATYNNISLIRRLHGHLEETAGFVHSTLAGPKDNVAVVDTSIG